LGSLLGQWDLARVIVHGDGREDRFEGVCVFTRSGPRVVQDEVGQLLTANGTFEATRRYIWAEAEGRLDVHFDDMRPFHSVPLGLDHCKTVHLCDPDRYEVTYDFARFPLWNSVWTVEGPRKAYRMVSRFRPARS
jgi:hypothetical protein